MKSQSLVLTVALTLIINGGCSRSKMADRVDGTVDSLGGNTLVGTWKESGGGVIKIATNHIDYEDLNCGRSGKIQALNQLKNCATGLIECGTFEFSVAPYNSVDLCNSPSVTVCSYKVSLVNSTKLLSLSCADRAKKLSLEYIAQ